MNTREIVHSALEGLDIPVFFHAWRPAYDKEPPPPLYITFHEMLNQTELSAEDTELIDGHYIALDIWGDEPTEETAEKVRNAMREMGAARRDERDIYEEDTKTYHRAMTWWFFNGKG